MDEWEARMRKATTDPRLPPTVCKDFVSALAYIDALRKDAERYRWLRDRLLVGEIAEAAHYTNCEDQAGVDAAIDAAMELHNASLSGQSCCIKPDAEK